MAPNSSRLDYTVEGCGGVWASYQIGHYFPGNIQFSMDGPTYYSEGTLASMLAGLQLTFGSHVGNRADQFVGEGYSREETDEYILIRNVSDGIIVHVEDKLGLVDAATGGLHENPGQIVVTGGVLALATIAMLGFVNPVLGIAVAAPLLAVFAGGAGRHPVERRGGAGGGRRRGASRLVHHRRDRIRRHRGGSARWRGAWPPAPADGRLRVDFVG